MGTEEGLLLQREQPATLEYRIISSPGSSRGPASLSPAATAAPAPGAKKSGYISEHGYLMELSRQERRRIEQEIKKRFKPGETGRVIRPHQFNFMFLGPALDLFVYVVAQDVIKVPL